MTDNSTTIDRCEHARLDPSFPFAGEAERSKFTDTDRKLIRAVVFRLQCVESYDAQKSEVRDEAIADVMDDVRALNVALANLEAA